MARRWIYPNFLILPSEKAISIPKTQAILLPLFCFLIAFSSSQKTYYAILLRSSVCYSVTLPMFVLLTDFARISARNSVPSSGFRTLFSSLSASNLAAMSSLAWIYHVHRCTASTGFITLKHAYISPPPPF